MAPPVPVEHVALPAAAAGTGVAVYVGGATATFEDLADRIAERLPLFIALVVGLSVILLMAVFRSVWVPLVSAAFNLLSIAAAYGVVFVALLVYVAIIAAKLARLERETASLAEPARGSGRAAQHGDDV